LIPGMRPHSDSGQPYGEMSDSGQPYGEMSDSGQPYGEMLK